MAVLGFCEFSGKREKTKRTEVALQIMILEGIIEGINVIVQ